jgi:hypothetical protein
MHIDFLGAPGVGKSTTYHSMIKQRYKGDRWLPLDEAIISIARECSCKNSFNFAEFALKVFVSLPITNRLQVAASKSFLSVLESELAWHSSEIYNELLFFVLNSALTKEKSPLQIFSGLNWFVTVFKKVLLVKNYCDDRIVVFDESLSQKVYGITGSQNSICENTVKDYFYLIPKPCMLIYFRLDLELLYERVIKREKIIYGHRSLNKELLKSKLKNQILIARIGQEIMGERGVKILNVDCSDSVDTNAKAIRDCIKSELI